MNTSSNTCHQPSCAQSARRSLWLSLGFLSLVTLAPGAGAQLPLVWEQGYDPGADTPMDQDDIGYGLAVASGAPIFVGSCSPRPSTGTAVDWVLHRRTASGAASWEEFYAEPSTQVAKAACIAAGQLITVGNRPSTTATLGGIEWVYESRNPDTGALNWRIGDDPSPADHGNTWPDDARACAPGNNSTFFVVGKGGIHLWHMEKREASTGDLIWQKQELMWPGSSGGIQMANSVVASGDDVFIAGTYVQGTDFRWGIHKRNELTGELDPLFGSAGRLVINVGGENIGHTNAIALDDEYIYIAGSKGAVGTNGVRAHLEVRDRITGAPVWSAQGAGIGAWSSIAINGNNVVVGGYNQGAGFSDREWRVDLYTKDTGGFRGTVTQGGQPSEVKSLASDGEYVYIGGYEQSSASGRRWRMEKRGFDCNADNVVDALQSGLAPSITSGPQSITLCQNTIGVLFSVTADQGSSGNALTYQWRKDGSSIPGATGSQLWGSTADLSAAGSYDVVVSSTCGTVTSPPALLTITVPPQVQAEGPGDTICEGEPASFLVLAAGTNLSYQWFHDGSPILGANGSSYGISSVTPSDAGLYNAQVSNSCGVDLSPGAQLVVVAPPVITADPVAATSCSGLDVDFSVTASASVDAPISGYAWFKNGSGSANALSDGASYLGTDTATLTVLAVDSADEGVYMCRVTNLCGSTDSSFANLTVNQSNLGPIVISGDSPACVGQPVQLSASGGSGGAIAWYVDAVSGSPAFVGDSYSFNAPSVTTNYFARRESGSCPASSAGSFTLLVKALPDNDSCVTAEGISVGIGQPFDNSCVADLGTPDCVRKGLWYSFVSTTCGTGHATATAGSFQPAVAVYHGSCSSGTLVGCDLFGSLDFAMEDGESYLVHVGSSTSIGGQGLLELAVDTSPPCPDEDRPSRASIYTFTGTASGQPWSWKIVSGDCTFQELYEGSVPALSSGAPVEEVASAFADSINAAAAAKGCTTGEIFATANPYLLLGKMTIGFHSDMSTSGLQLWVGPQNDPSCLVTTSSSGSGCNFILPAISVIKEDLPEEDCNENGMPDFFDILFGTSADVDGDGIPDECLSGVVGQAFCFGDGSSLPCPCGNESLPADQEGCVNSTSRGASLVADGSPSLSGDTLILRGEGLPNSTALFFQGFTQNAMPFGDGLRCVGGAVIRLGAVQVHQGSAAYPPSGGVSISLRGQIGAPGTARSYQAWYRDPAPFCTSAVFNFSNALAIQWLP